MRDGNIIAKIWKLAWPLLVFFMIQALTGVVGGTAVSFLGSSNPAYAFLEELLESPSLIILLLAVSSIVTAFIFWLVYLRDNRRRKKFAPQRLLTSYELTIPTVIFMLLFCVGGVLISSCIISFLPESAAYDELTDMIMSSGRIPVYLAVGVLGPVCEELLFRGLIYRRSRDFWGVLPAVLISSAVFGIAHMNGIQTVNAFILGILLAVCYEHGGTILFPMLVHILNNSFSVWESFQMANLPAEEMESAAPYLVPEFIAGVVLTVVFGWMVFARSTRENRI